VCAACAFTAACEDNYSDKTAGKEQAATEQNQDQLLRTQPPPKISWSLERDNLIKRFKLMNDRSVNFFMYVFIEGVGQPIGYYQVNKVSSVNSQLTNTEQLIRLYDHAGVTLPSPAEDGSYGTNGDGVFGFTPDQIYLETNMRYIVSSVPLNFNNVPKLAVINSDEARQMLEASKQAMAK
jgi:hypothetical protein